MKSRGQSDCGIIVSLAWADLRHDAILNLCLVLALTAVLGMLLTLFSLKSGIVETLRHRLVQDPRNREIRPATSRTYEREWLENVRQRDDVSFLVPMTRQIAAGVTGRGPGGRLPLDLVPTGPGDPLLLENGSAVPGGGECVLSAGAAATLQARVGGTVSVIARRLRGDASESASVELRVAGIAAERAGALAVLYAPLDFLEAVEAYKDGRAVPALGWEGALPLAYPLYDGAVVTLPEPLPPAELAGLKVGMGFTTVEELEPGRYRLATAESGVGEEALENLRRRLAGKEARVEPWIRPIAVEIDGRPAEVEISPVLRDDSKLVYGAFLEKNAGETVNVRVGALAFPLQVEVAEVTTAQVSARVGGILRLARQREVRFEDGEFLLGRQGYGGFRLYARSIDDVEGLADFFEKEGIAVLTQAARIRDVRELDRSLTRVFWLIAAAGIAGAAAALVANLYAATERKRRELSVLRLLGIERAHLLRFPIYQALMLTGATLVLALVFCWSISAVLNAWFARYLVGGERLAHLPWAQAAGVCVVSLALAAAAATLALGAIARVDPAEALRDE